MNRACSRGTTGQCPEELIDEVSAPRYFEALRNYYYEINLAYNVVSVEGVLCWHDDTGVQHGNELRAVSHCHWEAVPGHSYPDRQKHQHQLSFCHIVPGMIVKEAPASAFFLSHSTWNDS